MFCVKVNRVDVLFITKAKFLLVSDAANWVGVAGAIPSRQSSQLAFLFPLRQRYITVQDSYTTLVFAADNLRKKCCLYVRKTNKKCLFMCTFDLN